MPAMLPVGFPAVQKVKYKALTSINRPLPASQKKKKNSILHSDWVSVHS